MAGQKHRQYDAEFKKQAVKPCMEEGRTVS
jgi:transposase-like protein